MTKQIIFKDLENDEIHAGIKLENGDVICLCCGGVLPADEQTAEDGFELLRTFESWVDMDDELTWIYLDDLEDAKEASMIRDHKERVKRQVELGKAADLYEKGLNRECILNACDISEKDLSLVIDYLQTKETNRV